MADVLPPPIDATPTLLPVAPPPGSPDFERKQGKASPAGGVAPPATGDEPPQTAADPPLVAALDFVSERGKVVPLDHPFRLDGKLIDVVTVRRLLMQQLAELVASDRHADLYEIYAVMTGLSAAVLRGMDPDDGVKVTEVAWDFLPRALREVHASP